MSSSSKINFPNLDGIRFFAFFAVFVNHVVNSLGHKSKNGFVELFKYKYLSNGDLGVSFFFVLSGFLITYLLIHEKQEQGRIHVPHFYLRRILRIWPLYFLVLFLSLVLIPSLQPFIHGGFPMRIGINKLNPWMFTCFLGNMDFIYHGISNSVVSILWSVSVEEQFYLFWPLVVAITPRKYLWVVFTAFIGCSAAYRFGWSDGKSVNLKFHTLSCLSDLATGALLAALSMQQGFREFFRTLPRWSILLVYGLLIFLFMIRFELGMNKEYKLWIAAFLPLLFSGCFAFVLAEQNFSEGSFFKFSRLKTISDLGKYTYGMYCYHMLVFFFLLFFAQLAGLKVTGMNKFELFLLAVSGLLFTIWAAKMSYRYVEKPFLKLKDRFTKV